VPGQVINNRLKKNCKIINTFYCAIKNFVLLRIVNILSVMIRRHHNTKFLFLFLQAIAVAIICLGSLINFHQYKIWGKPLIPNFVGYKRDIEKYSKVASFSKFSRGDHFSQKHFSGTDGIFSPDDRLQGCCKGLLITTDFYRNIPVSARITSFGPRAPPAV